jgi:hypothetical protein
MGMPPPGDVVDRDLIQPILDKEFGTPRKRPEDRVN